MENPQASPSYELQETEHLITEWKNIRDRNKVI